MTPQEAIKFFKNEITMLKNAPQINGCEMTEEWAKQIEIFEMAIDAIEKQTPKKVTHEATKYKDFTCPNCKNVISENTDYCKFCGQALDWGEEEWLKRFQQKK